MHSLKCSVFATVPLFFLRLQYNGTAHMTYGNYLELPCSALGYLGMGIVDCLSWCTPVLPDNDYVYTFLLHQFEPTVWLALIGSVLSVSMSLLLLRVATPGIWTANDIFNLALQIYGAPSPTNPRSLSGRLIVCIWLFACLVLRTVYEGKMKVNYFSNFPLPPLF